MAENIDYEMGIINEKIIEHNNVIAEYFNIIDICNEDIKERAGSLARLFVHLERFKAKIRKLSHDEN